jgi:Zn finger protein HypA/HybF involved in hydrogenase expression
MTEAKCPTCDAPAPEQQIKTLGECERCHYDPDQTISTKDKKKSSDADIIAEWQS